MLHTSQFTVGRTKGPVCATNFCFWWTVPLNFERVGFVYQKSSTYIKTILHFLLFCETDSSINLHLNNCYEKIAYIRWLSLVHWIGKVLFFTSYIYIDISIYLHIYLYIYPFLCLCLNLNNFINNLINLILKPSFIHPSLSAPPPLYSTPSSSHPLSLHPCFYQNRIRIW